eukprot:15463235-Alexandrium_andersonii.AAC.1
MSCLETTLWFSPGGNQIAHFMSIAARTINLILLRRRLPVRNAIATQCSTRSEQSTTVYLRRTVLPPSALV